MKKAEIKVGGHYIARISGKLVAVRVDAIRERDGFKRIETVYDVTNLVTGRKTTFRSAAKFRGEAKTMRMGEESWRSPAKGWIDGNDKPVISEVQELAQPEATADRMLQEEREAEQCSDPTSENRPQASCGSGSGTSSAEGEQCADPTKTSNRADPASPHPASAEIQTVRPQETATRYGTTSNGLAGRIAATRRVREVGSPVAGMVPNEEQEHILAAAVEQGLRVMVIAAGAGTGKTATLKMLEQVLPGKGQYTAFNTSLVAESKAKFVKAACNTTHSLAFRAVGKQYQHRLGGERMRSEQIARILGIEPISIILKGAGPAEIDQQAVSEADAAYRADPTPENRAALNEATAGKPTDKEKILRPGFLAGQVLSAIKRFCQSADREIGPEHIRIDSVDRENSGRVRDYLLPYCAKAWIDLSRVDGQLPFTHDVYVKCQPAGTMVAVVSKYSSAFFMDVKKIPIEQVQVGDRVYGVPEHSKGTLTENLVTKIGQRHYEGDLVTVNVEGMESKYTPDHICIARLGDVFDENVVVYLMKRGNSYRVGRVQWRYGSQNNTHGIVTRAKDQDADALWILSIHNSDPDAAIAEATTQYLFGIPGWQFSSRNETMPLDQFWRVVGDNSNQASACAASFGRDLRYPMWDRERAGKWNRAAVEVRACNLMTGMKFFDAKRLHERSLRDNVWRRGEVTRQPFSGIVYSLEVDGDSTYIADGIGTHNCWQLGQGDDRPIIPADYILVDEYQDTAEVFCDVLKQQTHTLLVLVGDDCQRIYEWRGAINAADEFPDAPRRLLSQSYRFGQAIADVANTILATLEEPTDLVMRGMPTIPSRVALVVDPRCYLYRTNTGAVGRVMAAIATGKRPHLIGGGDEVVRWMKAAMDLQARRGTQHPELCCFDTWNEVVEYSKTDEGSDLRLMVKLVTDFGAGRIHNALKNMPKEEDADLVVSTAHKSKGREWDTVQLGPDFPLSNGMADPDRRLLYVAATRAKLTLDVSACPTFCGGTDRNDNNRWVPGLEIVYTSPVLTEEEQTRWIAERAGVTGGAAVPPAAVVPAVPVVPPAPPKWTWCNWSDRWCLRGPLGTAPGTEVVVAKKSGATSKEVVGKMVKEFSDAAVYAVNR